MNLEIFLLEKKKQKKQKQKQKQKNKTKTEKTKIKKKIVYNNAINLYNTLLTIFFNQNNHIRYRGKEDIDKKFDPSNLLIADYRFNVLKKKGKEKSKSQPEETIAERVKLRRQEADDEYLSDMPPVEGDQEEVKEGKGLKFLTPNKLLTRLLIFLAQIKAGNNSCKLKSEIIRQMLYFLYQHNKITKNVYNNLLKSL